MSWWNLSPCSSLTSPRFSGKKSKCDSRKWIFRLTLHPTVLYEVNRSCTTSWQFAALWFPKKSLQILLNDNHAFLSVSFRSSSNCLFVLHQFPDLGPNKYTLLDFCVTHIWELIPQIFESTADFIHTFHKVLHNAQLYVQRGQVNFSGRTRGGLMTFFSPGVTDVRLGHSLFTLWFFLSRLSHSHRKQQYFMYPRCIPSNSATTWEHHIPST